MPEYTVDLSARYVLTDKGRRDLAEALAEEAVLFDLCPHVWMLQRTLWRGDVEPIMKCAKCGDWKRLPRDFGPKSVPK